MNPERREPSSRTSDVFEWIVALACFAGIGILLIRAFGLLGIGRSWPGFG